MSPEPETSTSERLLSLEQVDIREALATRPHRPPNYAAEDSALAILAAELARSPRNMLQKLVESALDLCQADTAGISFLENQNGIELFRWEAIAGVFAAARNGTMPRDASPCGVCIDKNATQLMYLADRCFPALRNTPRFVEALLVPFHCEGRPVGTVWVVTHGFNRKFDREDERIIRTLSAFASAGWQLCRTHEDLEQRVATRTAELANINAALQTEIEDRKRAEAAILRYQEALRGLTARLIEAQEAESKRLARELHDDFCQNLTALGMKMGALARRKVAKSISAQILEIKGQIDASAQGIHRFSRRLHSAILEDLGLAATLQNECIAFTERHGITATFLPNGVPAVLPEAISLCLHRITQEGLRNVAKHSKATEVRVVLTGGLESIGLEIDDNGAGFDPGAVRGHGGLGFVSMEERVRLVNGTLSIATRPGTGVRISVRVPVPPMDSAVKPEATIEESSSSSR